MFVHLMMRLILAIILSVIGWQVGKSLLVIWPDTALANGRYYPIIVSFVGAGIGLAAGPALLDKPWRALQEWLQRLSARTLFFGTAGAMLGMLLAALLSSPLSMLPGLWGAFMPITVALAAGAMGAWAMARRGHDILAMLGLAPQHELYKQSNQVVLLDTSVIIDGRIADIGHTGFVRGTMLCPSSSSMSYSTLPIRLTRCAATAVDAA